MLTAVRHLCRLVVACITLAIASTVSAVPASAATHPCKLGVNSASAAKMDFGKSVPVILIHGIFGSPADWTSQKDSSVCNKIDLLPGIQVALNFKYKTDNWNVIAKEFASQVSKIATQSAKNGGSGRVIIVGYSQGTIIARTAIDNHKLEDKVGQVITIAAPAGAANPWDNYPSGVIVRAIGGDITNAVVKGKKTTYEYTKSDGLIPLSHALKRYTDNPEVGGGRVTAQCTKTYSKKVGGKHLKPFNTLCDHGNLLRNPVVLESVLAGISAYADSLTPAKVRTWTIANTLTLRLNDRWGEIKSATGQDIEGFAYELNTRKELQVASDVMLPISLPQIDTAPAIAIGGRMPDYSAIYTENTIPLRYSMIWCFSSKNLCVSYRGGLNLNEITPSSALLEVFSTATWLN